MLTTNIDSIVFTSVEQFQKIDWIDHSFLIATHYKRFPVSHDLEIRNHQEKKYLLCYLESIRAFLYMHNLQQFYDSL